MGASEVVALVAAAVGAFLGSTSAFLLEAWRRARAEENLRYGLILEGQFALAMQLRTMVNIRDQYLKPHRDAADRFMVLVPFYGESNDPTVDLGALGFVAAEDEIGVLQKLHMSQDAYLTAMFALRSRNDMMADVYAAAVPRGDFDFESGAETVGWTDGSLADLWASLTDSTSRWTRQSCSNMRQSCSSPGQANAYYPNESLLPWRSYLESRLANQRFNLTRHYQR